MRLHMSARRPRTAIPGAKGDLPDWVWVGTVGCHPPTGLLEAKGTYFRNKMNATMQGAAGQLTRRILLQVAMDR